MTTTLAQEHVRLAERIIAELAPDYRLKVDTRAIRRLGQTRYALREIGISKHVFDMDTPILEDTVRHECAHARIGPGYGHGPVWKREAIRCGCRPRSHTKISDDAMPKAPWVFTCAKGCKGTRYRAPKQSLRMYGACGKHRMPIRWEKVA